MPKSENDKPAETPLTISALKGEVEITAFKSGGPGGQHKNKTESAVRLKHLPTGIIVVATESRSQIKNRELAWQRLIEKLAKRRQKRKPRLRTQPSKAAKEKRLEEKMRRSSKKQARQKILIDD
ncbi:MAG: peptide chain release factor-like protein [candidate division KSB1 bacterium]|nr:peptide chain release factor-like protein [candidate division KSB1 bacterium]MDZ7364456.1 peptide chain release factor-like protein [candidate division KSB1 bacterium]MDZ7402828.1 peptide chain release factor-like protein [candidate division KSB1 bacterium]